MGKVLLIDSKGNKKEIEFKLSEKSKKELDKIRKEILLPICKKCPFYKDCWDNEKRNKSRCKIRL